MRHHDPDGMGGSAAAGRACTSESSKRAWPLSRLASWGQHEAPFEACEARAATHLALEPFHARELPLHRPMTPGQGGPQP
jgi:hypothetical protein